MSELEVALDRTGSEFDRQPASMWHRLSRQVDFRIGCAVLGLVGLCAAAPTLVLSASPAGRDPLACSLRAPDGTYQDRLPPSWQHWFGTDHQGCDEFARVVFGARSSLTIGLGTALLATLIGTALGIVAGWREGWADAAVRRAGDVTLGVPFVVGAILVLAMLTDGQRSTPQLTLTLALLTWPGSARIARSATRSIKRLDFVEASRAAGASDTRLMFGHVLPNALPSIIAYATPLVGLVIAAEATLTYLGVGLQIPAISWGLMIDAAQGEYSTSPHLLLFPGVLLAMSIAGFILLGDALTRALGGPGDGG
jgi:oligopeptide transport system permease protein